ncbi:hypothetical protein GGTG_07245 [Gaeumannomyces tritici R3-111a-1]|uniref:Uncharacterized protein n=1 Tax=Gaeumannomyces tritici (strain R3-111a-1) TaxID=644352 RepID=J3P148_GAET3|nr:hypothetical protein GGTG_07245 [Gaeumannomyces tritici R3-111a-1]EJT77333.1 hypothetical protein GGTG_07245 [Gaeumannomyces tritici R3-111a-1]
MRHRAHLAPRGENRNSTPSSTLRDLEPQGQAPTQQKNTPTGRTSPPKPKPSSMSLDAEPGPCTYLVYWARDSPGGWTSAHSTSGPVESRRVNECCRPERLTRAGDDCNYWCADPRERRRRRRRGDDNDNDNDSGCSPAQRLRGCLRGNATAEPYKSRCVAPQPPPTTTPGPSDGGVDGTAGPSKNAAGGTRTPKMGMRILLMQALVISSLLARPW